MSTRRKIQLLLWAYFWLVIFEGALRKWIFPGLSTPLLAVRDPIAIAAIMIGLPYLRRRPWVGWVGWLWGIGGAALILALTVGHGDMIVALYGVRILFFHLPLIFLFAAVFDSDEVWKFVKMLALLTIPMVVLLGAQFSHPTTHWLNIAPGGEGTSVFSAALGKFRCSGTFSFTNGVVEFFALAGAGVVAWLLGGPRPLPKWLWISVAALIAALPLSISRGLFFKYAGVAVGGVVAGSLSGGKIKIFLVWILLGGVFLTGISFIPAVQLAQQAFEVRWERATEAEGGEAGVQGVLEKRVGGSTFGVLADAFDGPILGYGIGLGTNVGAMRIGGKRAFLVGEGAWQSTIAELGPLFGLMIIGMRVVLGIFLLRRAWTQARRGNSLPLALGSFALLVVVLSGTGQPTALGFIVVGAGLMLAACNPTKAELLRRRAATMAARSPKETPALMPKSAAAR